MSAVATTGRLDSVVGGRSADALSASFDIHTVGDLLRHYPRRYVERGKLTPIAGLEPGEHVTVLAVVRSCTSRQMQRKRGTIQNATISDGSRSLSLTFFNQRHLPKTLTPGAQGLFAGKITLYQGSMQLTHPDFRLLDDADGSEAAAEFARPLIPVYPATKDLSSWSIAQCVRQTLDVLDDVEDPLPESLRTEHGLLGLAEALTAIHRPESHADLARAQQRLKWDEALAVQLVLAQRRHVAGYRPAPRCPRRPDGVAAAFDAALPFELTAGQADVGAELAEELAGEHPMNRLLQGEVGSGKTIVALRAMLQVVDAGRQAALLAPTEVLAAQHARSLRAMLGALGRAGELGAADQSTAITLLTGSLPTKVRRQAMLDAASGAAGIVVGTHALIQDRVSFADLGLVVVDEQHRFGVEQRDALRSRAGEGTSPHVLVMTATPIPRTVAMTVYGDLETSSLRELPRGRAPIETTVVPVGEKPAWLERVWARITEEVADGRQAYVVCPRIGEDPDAPAPAKRTKSRSPEEPDDGEPDDGTERRPPIAVLDLVPRLVEGPLSALSVGILHGRLPADDKDAAMLAFADGSTAVLVATTVVEVGVDVPNATVMVIMDAHRFGVSQLHQLRGRVGRGGHRGLCLLVTDMPPGTGARERLDAVASTVDGFELAQLDLELRREGDVLGATQSGRRSGLRLLSLIEDEPLIREAREQARRLVEADPELSGTPALARLTAEVLDADRAEYLEKG